MPQHKLLIVEDEAPLAAALQHKLSHEQIMAGIAHNGDEAIKLLAESDYDLVLLDLLMPQTDGFAVLEWLRANHKTPQVVVLSNFVKQDNAQRIEELGLKEEDFLVKSNTSLAEIATKVFSRLGIQAAIN